MADSWMTDGNCDNCRRKSYCSTQCTANKKHEASRLSKLAMQIVAEGYKLLHKEDK